MTIRRRLAVGIAWMFAGNWAEQAMNFVVFILLARLLGPEVFGLAAMASVFVLLAEFLVRETVTETILQLETVEEGHLDAVFWLLGGLSVTIVAAIIGFAEPIARLFSEPRVAEYVVWATPSVLFIGFSGVPVARLRRDLEFRVLAIRATLGVTAGGLVGLALALLEFGVWSLIAQRVVQVFVNNALAWIASPWRPGLRAQRRHLRDVVGFSARMVGLRASELVSLNAPTVIVGSYLGPVALGQYTVAWRLIEILTFVLIAPVRYVAQPGFALLDRETRRAGRLLQEVMDASSLIVWPSLLGVVAVGGSAMLMLFGPDWKPGVPALQVLCVVGIYLSFERLQSSFCIALGRAGGLLVASMLEAAIGIVAMVLAVDHGLVGVAAAFAASYLVVWPARLVLVTTLAEVRLGPYLARFVPPLLASLLLLAVVLAWQQAMATRLGVIPLLVSSCALGILVYAGCLALAMRRRVEDVVRSLRSMREIAQGGPSSP